MALAALLSLEQEKSTGEFFVWAIVDRIYQLSHKMQGLAREVEEARADRKAKALAGDVIAMRLVEIEGALRRRPGPRTRRTSPPGIAEDTFNPSRVLAGLEARGLIQRRAIKGGGSAGLTPEGRRVALEQETPKLRSGRTSGTTT